MFHVGGLDNFRSVFGDDSPFFLVLCGHHHGQALPIEPNASGHIVHQILADYQDRGQAGLDAGQPLECYMRAPAAIGPLVGATCRVVGIDLAERETPIPLAQVVALAGDVENPAIIERLFETLEGERTDVLLPDVAQKLIGEREADLGREWMDGRLRAIRLDLRLKKDMPPANPDEARSLPASFRSPTLGSPIDPNDMSKQRN